MLRALSASCLLFVVLVDVIALPSDIRDAGDLFPRLSHGRVAREATKSSKSELMCKKYAEYVFTYEYPPILLGDDEKEKVDNCAINAQPLIVGGVAAEPKEFPHIALIGYGKGEPNVTWLCGGSLISERFVLSAAHCVESPQLGKAKWAKMGDLVVFEEGDDSDPVTIEIINWIVHPDYRKDRVYNDIALFKLKDEVSFSPYVRPLCLHTRPNITDEKALAAGWGRTSANGSPTKQLMKVTLPLAKTSSCSSIYKKSNPKLPQGIDSKSMLCAGGQKGKDTCQGDSGGPLMIKLTNPYCMYSLIGLTSFGPECASGVPAVYTRISNFIPWIEKNAWP